MPRPSIFTRCGHFRFSSAPPFAQTIYESLVAAVGGDSDSFDLSPGTHEEARLYALAMELARARIELERAKQERHGATAAEMLPSLEKDHRISPPPNANLPARRAAVVVRELLSRGAVRENVVNALQTALGSKFVALRTTKPSENVLYPSNPATRGLWGRPQDVRTVFQFTGPVSFTGVPVTVGFCLYGATQTALPIPPSSIAVGTVFVAQPENDSLSELVTVTGLNLGANTLTATFTKSHDVGGSFCTLQYPLWSSTARHSFVVLTPAAAADPVARRTVDDIMRRLMRGVSTWDVVAQTVGGMGPFVLGQTLLGTSPLGTVTLP